MDERTCTVDGCSKPTRAPGSDLCPMHYHRRYRHGSVDKVSHRSGITASLGRRYIVRSAAHHPLADKYGRVYVHRQVLYDAIGPGPHSCHWCGTQIDWKPKGAPGELQPDHLNNDGADNRLENLVPSCRRCNSTRGSQRKADALRAAGWWSQHDTIATLRTQGRADRIEPLSA